jgi:hypothetical protein
LKQLLKRAASSIEKRQNKKVFNFTTSLLAPKLKLHQNPNSPIKQAITIS